jgi:hypothetical protein
MLKKLRPRSAYDVMAAIACFGVLAGGTAYAANTIGSSDVIDESLLSQDIKNREVKAADIGANAVNGGHLADGSLTRADVAAGQFGTAPAAATFASHSPDTGINLDSSYQQVIYTGDHGGTFGATGGEFVHLSAPGRLLANTSLFFHNSSDTTDMAVSCHFGAASAATIGSPPPQFGNGASAQLPPRAQQSLSLTAGVRKPAGDYFVNVECSAGTVQFWWGDLVVWALPQR